MLQFVFFTVAMPGPTALRMLRGYLHSTTNFPELLLESDGIIGRAMTRCIDMCG